MPYAPGTEMILWLVFAIGFLLGASVMWLWHRVTG
jgi:hypothetical protein